jgi:hypothetical protein
MSIVEWVFMQNNQVAVGVPNSAAIPLPSLFLSLRSGQNSAADGRL